MKTNEVKTTEQWLPIQANPSYEISDLGRVRHTFLNGNTKPVQPTGNKQKRNYQFIRIEGKKHYIHHLVLAAFVGEKPERHDADHIDTDPTNNKLTNLRYLSIAENRGKRGELHNLAKLTEEKVRAIRSLYEQNLGLTLKKLAQLFDVSINAVHNVITRKTWSHV
jgi:hypothetical protein